MEERKKRIILIGRSAAGKTTLCQRINHEDLAYHKTQTVQVINQTMIDTPGEYLERRYFRGALMVTATDADVIVFVQDATEDGTMFTGLFEANPYSHEAVRQYRKMLNVAAAGDIELLCRRAQWWWKK